MKKIAPNVKLGEGVKIYDFCNLYGCEIGENTRIGTFVEIQKGVTIGKTVKFPATPLSVKGYTSRMRSLWGIM